MPALVVGTPERSLSILTTRYAPILRSTLVALSVSIAYYAGAKIGFALTFQPHPVSTLWPPNAILLAALLLTPVRWWWFLLLAALPAHLLAELNANVPPAMVLCWFVSNCSEALIGASVLRYLRGREVQLDSTRDVEIFILVALLAPFLSSFLDAAFVMLNKHGNSPYWSVFRMRFFSNVLASLSLVPLILTWKAGGISALLKASKWRYLEVSLLATCLLIVGIASFATQKAGQNTTPAFLYLPLPLLLWAAIRFGPRGSSTALVAVSFFAIWGAIHGIGPFATQSAEMNALSVQLFLIVAAMPLLFLAALIKERERAQELASQKEERLEMALDAAQMGTWDWRIVENTADWSAHTKRIFGLSPTDKELSPEGFYSLIHVDDQLRIKNAVNRAVSDGASYEAEFRMQQQDGTVRWVRGVGKVIVDKDGRPVRMTGVNLDVTQRRLAEQALHHSHNQIRELLGRLIDVQESERRRISRELHDDLSQKVATLSISISRLKRRLPMPESQLIAELDELREETNRLTSEIRTLSHQLHPAVLEHLGLVTALESYIHSFRNEEQIDVSLTAEIGDEKIPFQTSICIYRVAVEALRNISRHSGASSASISLKRYPDLLELQVSDSGKGFDVENLNGGNGLGLVSIEERLRFLQGSYEIHSTPENGTTLVARVPLN